MLHDLRLLRPFLVLADELHFTRAAERLHIAQPALSQQIARLEQQVGAVLFVRAPQGVSLTEAGQVLLERAAPAVRAIDAGVEAAQDVAAGRSGVLRVGFLSSLSGPVVPMVAAAFRRQASGVELRLSERSMLEQLAELRTGRIDVALFSITEDVDLDDRDLNVDLLVSGPLYAALAASHPRAGAREIALAELAGESFVVPSGTDERGYRAGLFTRTRRHGFTARAGPQADNVATMLGLVASGFGVALVGWQTALVPRPEVAFVRVADERIDLVAVRARDGGGAAADAFVSTVREVLESLVPQA